MATRLGAVKHPAKARKRAYKAQVNAHEYGGQGNARGFGLAVWVARRAGGYDAGLCRVKNPAKLSGTIFKRGKLGKGRAVCFYGRGRGPTAAVKAAMRSFIKTSQ